VPTGTAFQRARIGMDGGPGRLVLFTTKGATPLGEFVFQPDDVLLFGSEPSGAPDFVHEAADARVVIPIRPGARSLNLSVSAGIALWEGLRSSSLLPLAGEVSRPRAEREQGR